MPLVLHSKDEWDCGWGKDYRFSDKLNTQEDKIIMRVSHVNINMSICSRTSSSTAGNLKYIQLIETNVATPTYLC